jgi:hypothetical protein
MGRLLNLMLALCAKTGSAVLFVHHAPKSTEGREDIYYGRGSSVFGDRVDSALSLVPYREQEDGNRLRLSFTLRNGPPRDSLIVWRGKDESRFRAVQHIEDVKGWLRALVEDEGTITLQAALERYRGGGMRSEYQFKAARKALETAALIHSEEHGFPKSTWLMSGPKA